jgi:hypothetical protein
MLNNPLTSPPEQAPTTRRQALKYIERFGRWARKLPDDDLHMVVAFCANIQMAWSEGQEKAKTAAESVEKGLPGLGAPLLDPEQQTGFTADCLVLDDPEEFKPIEQTSGGPLKPEEI